MTLALDTNVLVQIDNKQEDVISFMRNLAEKEATDPVLPFPVFSEFYYGYIKNQKQNYALKILGDFEIIHSSEGSAKIFAEIKYALEKKGVPMNLLDILIAAICIDNDLTLVTLDSSFRKIDNLDKIILEF